jgi:hypothetical protein
VDDDVRAVALNEDLKHRKKNLERELRGFVKLCDLGINNGNFVPLYQRVEDLLPYMRKCTEDGMSSYFATYALDGDTATIAKIKAFAKRLDERQFETLTELMEHTHASFKEIIRSLRSYRPSATTQGF